METLVQAKDYLVFENDRNKKHAALYTRLISLAEGKDCSIMIGHHLTFEHPTQDAIEIPSADTMLFDHDVMGRVFGQNATGLMVTLASTPVDSRDAILADALDNLLMPAVPSYT